MRPMEELSNTGEESGAVWRGKWCSLAMNAVNLATERALIRDSSTGSQPHYGDGSEVASTCDPSRRERVTWSRGFSRR